MVPFIPRFYIWWISPPTTTTYTENCNPESKKGERIVKNTEKGGGGSYVKMRVRFSSLVVVEGYIIVFVE